MDLGVLREFILHLSRIIDWLRLEGISGVQLVHLPSYASMQRTETWLWYGCGTDGDHQHVLWLCIHRGGMRREKGATLPNLEGTISSHIQDMPAHHTGVELVFPRCCSEVDASLCGLCSLWKLLWSSVGIW